MTPRVPPGISSTLVSTVESGRAQGYVSSSRWAAWYVLALLCMLIIVSAIDRLIVSLVIIPLRADIGISDTQVGLIFGTTFAVFYGVVGLPIARLVDRSSRKWLIVSGVTLWSAATLGTAFVHDGWSLAALRIGLAIGEAVLTPAAVSLISDLFAPRARSLPTSIYMLSTQFGAHAAYLIGAMIVGVFGASATVDIPVLGTFANWRAVFVCVGIPGLVIAPLMAFTTKEARRQALAQGVPNLAKVVADLGTNWRLFAGLFVGVGINAAIVHAFGTWLITYLIRTFQWTASDAGYLYGMVGLVASMGGAAFLPAISGMVERAGRKDALILTAVVSIVLGNLCAAAGVLSGNPVLTTLMVGPAIFSTIGAITLVLIALHDLSPPGALGTLCALQVLSGSALGMAIGPPLTAFLTDSFYAGPQAMQWALATVPLLITPVSLALIGGAYRPYLAHRARRDDGESEN